MVSDFNDPATRTSAINNLKGLVDHPGWLLLKEILDENQADMLNLLATKDYDDLSEQKVDQAKWFLGGVLINYPYKLIDALNSPEVTDASLDPYE